MSRIVADRVQETSITTGTSPYQLNGPTTGFRAASTVCVNGDTFTYHSEDVDAYGNLLGNWETGLGTWGTGNLLTRSSIYASSNSNTYINWGVGTRRISLSLTATASLGPTTVTGALIISSTISASNLSGTNSGDQTATTITFTPTGNIISTTTQSAIAEIATTRYTKTEVDTLISALRTEIMNKFAAGYSAN